MRLVTIIACVVLTVLGIGSARADKRVALVIGNSAYRDVTPLENPANDANLIADTLRGLGFTLVGGGAQVNLDKTAIDRAVQSFGAQLAGADVGLFYYAGHGLQVRDANYLVPVDANPTKEADVDFQMLDADTVLRQMESAGTRLNIVILDACRNNPFLAVGPGGRMRSASRGLARMQAPEGTLISFATQPGSVAQDGTEGHSPYSRALAETLRAPGLGIFETFNQVGLEVKRATAGAQQPWVSSSPIEGAFYFVPSGKAGDVALVALPPAPATASARTAFDEAAVRQLADRQKIPLPPTFAVKAPDKSMPAQFQEYVGAWGGDERYCNSDGGRNVLLVVENIGAGGAVIGLYAEGPTTTPGRSPPRYFGFTGQVADDGLTFTHDRFKYTYKVLGGDLMSGRARGSIGAETVDCTIRIQRINSTEQVASIALTDQARTGPAAGSPTTTSPPQGQARGDLSGPPAFPPQADGLFTEQDMRRVEAIAARDKLEVMPPFMIERPDKRIPEGLRKFVGIWASDIGFTAGNGRHAMLIVTNVQASARATGYWVAGSPTKGEKNRNPAGAYPFDGKIIGDQLTAQPGAFSDTATLSVGGTISVVHKPATGQLGYVTLKPVWRLVDAEQSDQARAVPADSSDISNVRRFDGLWVAEVVCDKLGKGSGYSRTFVGNLENGSFHGEWGPQGEPGFTSFDGTVKRDGAIQLTQSGLSDGGATAANGATDRGTKFAFSYTGRLDGPQGRALRVEGRTCHLTLAKQ